MTEFKLETGKRYVTRDGKISEMVYRLSSTEGVYKHGYRFQQLNGQYYTEDGRRRLDGIDGLDDLVAEATIINNGNRYIAEKNQVLLCKQENPSELILKHFWEQDISQAARRGYDDDTLWDMMIGFTIDIMSGAKTLKE